jgi:hypothetical protein
MPQTCAWLRALRECVCARACDHLMRIAMRQRRHLECAHLALVVCDGADTHSALIVLPQEQADHLYLPQKQNNLQQTIFNKQSSTNNLQQTIFNKQSSTNNLQQTIFNKQSSTNNLQQTIFNKQSSTNNLQQTIFNKQSSTNNLQQTIFNKLSGVNK